MRAAEGEEAEGYLRSSRVACEKNKKREKLLDRWRKRREGGVGWERKVERMDILNACVVGR